MIFPHKKLTAHSHHAPRSLRLIADNERCDVVTIWRSDGKIVLRSLKLRQRQEKILRCKPRFNLFIFIHSTALLVVMSPTKGDEDTLRINEEWKYPKIQENFLSCSLLIQLMSAPIHSNVFTKLFFFLHCFCAPCLFKISTIFSLIFFSSTLVREWLSGGIFKQSRTKLDEVERTSTINCATLRAETILEQQEKLFNFFAPCEY